MTTFLDLDIEEFIRAVTMHENQEDIDYLFFILDRLNIKNVRNFRYDGGRLKEVMKQIQEKAKANLKVKEIYDNVKKIYDDVIQEIDEIVDSGIPDRLNHLLSDLSEQQALPPIRDHSAVIYDGGGKRRKKSKSKKKKSKSKRSRKSKRKRSKTRRRRR
tara:strand:+ start:1020 stop:1496 length:477 start_codon:yes stop_codon:yes gene_type:complete